MVNNYTNKRFSIQSINCKQNTVITPISVAALICVVFVYSGLISFNTKKAFICPLPKNGINCLTGTVNSTPIKTGDKYKVIVKVKTVSGLLSDTNLDSLSVFSASGCVPVFINSSIVESLYPGKLYTAAELNKGILVEEGAVINVFGHFSKNEAFYADKVTSLGWTNTFPSIARFRALGRLSLKRLLYSWGDAGGLLIALLTGSREYTNPDVTQGFTNAGLAHILALSGMHLSIVSSMALVAGSLLLGKKVGYLLSLIAVIIFVWFTGASPSLIRALICSLCLSLATLCNIKTSMIEILAFSFILHSILRPDDLFTTSFQLSYGALAGILLFSKSFSLLFRTLPSVISDGLGASLGAQTSTAPVCVKQFGVLSPVGILASVIVSPIATLFVKVGTIGIILSLIFPSLSKYVGIIVNVLYYCLKIPVLFFAKFPHIEVI